MSMGSARSRRDATSTSGSCTGSAVTRTKPRGPFGVGRRCAKRWACGTGSNGRKRTRRRENDMNLMAVTVEGHGDLPRLAGPDAAATLGWWIDDQGVTVVRLPDQPVATLLVRTTT